MDVDSFRRGNASRFINEPNDPRMANCGPRSKSFAADLREHAYSGRHINNFQSRSSKEIIESRFERVSRKVLVESLARQHVDIESLNSPRYSTRRRTLDGLRVCSSRNAVIYPDRFADGVRSCCLVVIAKSSTTRSSKSPLRPQLQP